MYLSGAYNSIMNTQADSRIDASPSRVSDLTPIRAINDKYQIKNDRYYSP